MIQAAKIIGIGMTTTGLIGANLNTNTGLVALLLTGSALSLLIYLYLDLESDLVDSKAPGSRCPRCAEEGIEIWVLRGKHCPRCGQPC